MRALFFLKHLPVKVYISNHEIYSIKIQCVRMLSHVQLFATPWIVAHEAPLSIEFSRQEYWRGSPFPFPGDLPDPGTEPVSPSPALAGRFFTTEPLGNPVK